MTSKLNQRGRAYEHKKLPKCFKNVQICKITCTAKNESKASGMLSQYKRFVVH